MITLKINKTIKNISISTVGIAATLFAVASLSPSTASADWVGVIQSQSPSGEAAKRGWADSKGSFAVSPSTDTSSRLGIFATNGVLHVTLVHNGVVLADHTVNGQGRLRLVARGSGIGGAEAIAIVAVNGARQFLMVYQNTNVPAGTQVTVDMKGNYDFTASKYASTYTTLEDDGINIAGDGTGNITFTVTADPAS